MAAQQLPHSACRADVPRSAPPAVPPPGSADELDLDTQISLVEQRLIGREQRLWSQVHGLGQRARQAAAPRTLLLKVGGAAIAGAGLVWALRRGAAGSWADDGRASAPAQASGPSQLLSLLPLAWPLLPPRWRTRISPAATASLLSVAVPLLQHLLARPGGGTGKRRAPPTVARLDLLRYAGTWHEQARLPAPFEHGCSGQPCATYAPLGTHPGQWAVHNACRGANGQLRIADGVARMVPGSGGARLQISFMPTWLRWLPLAWADLWVLHVDESASDYRVAIAGHPSRKGLWLLSRSPQLPADELQRLVALASDLGYETSRLVMSGPPAHLH